MSDQKKLLFAASGTAIAALATYGISTWWNHYKNNCVPTTWHKVGELVDLTCFPIKSCGPIRLNEFQCLELGLKNGFLRDRTFMVIGNNGNFVTGRRYPKMTQICPSVEGEYIVLSAKGEKDTPSVRINIKELHNQPRIKAKVWDDAVDTVDCGDEAAVWLSRYVLDGKESGLRLVYYPEQKTTRAIMTQNRGFVKILNKDYGALPDVSAFSLISESSVEDLNTRLEKSVVPQNFRPNFVLRGAKPYEEHDWDWVKIGDVVFRNIKPTTRCIFTTVDPNTGVKNPEMEPLKTLKGYRQLTDVKLRRAVGNSPMMGIHLGLRTHGSVKLGDSVFMGGN